MTRGIHEVRGERNECNERMKQLVAQGEQHRHNLAQARRLLTSGDTIKPLATNGASQLAATAITLIKNRMATAMAGSNTIGWLPIAMKSVSLLSRFARQPLLKSQMRKVIVVTALGIAATIVIKNLVVQRYTRR